MRRNGDIMLRFLTAGETHGKCLTAIIEGMPSGIIIDAGKINKALAARQEGYGRGGRMKIETDTVSILSGVRNKVTLGSPIALQIENKDYKNWSNIMDSQNACGDRGVYCPRPGHADLTGAMKYAHEDMRNVLERASARETAARVAVGAIAEQALEQFGIELFSRVVNIGEVYDDSTVFDKDFFERVKKSSVGFGSEKAQKAAEAYIDKIKEEGDSVGGSVEVTAIGVPPGLGSYVHYDRKLDGMLAQAVMSIQAIKGVEIGIGFEAARLKGSMVHDEIAYNGKFYRLTNRAGGIEGSMSNGEPIIVRAAMKPIPTLYKPLGTVNIKDKSEVKASVERSDVCAVKACSAVVKAAVAFEIWKAFLDKFGGDCMEDISSSYESYKKRISDI